MREMTTAGSETTQRACIARGCVGFNISNDLDSLSASGKIQTSSNCVFTDSSLKLAAMVVWTEGVVDRGGWATGLAILT